MVKWFTSLEYINWTRLWWIVGIITTFWLGLVTILPAAVFKPVSVILAALQSGFLFAARGGKYVAERQPPPQDGKV